MTNLLLNPDKKKKRKKTGEKETNADDDRKEELKIGAFFVCPTLVPRFSNSRANGKTPRMTSMPLLSTKIAAQR